MYASTSQDTKNNSNTEKERASLEHSDKSYQGESEVDVSFENHPNACLDKLGHPSF